jgi:hypothetical protein
MEQTAAAVEAGVAMLLRTLEAERSESVTAIADRLRLNASLDDRARRVSGCRVATTGPEGRA